MAEDEQKPLIAPVKEENSAKEKPVNNQDCMNDAAKYLEFPVKKPEPLSISWHISREPVPSEQEKQEEADFLGPHNIKDEKWIIVATHFKTYKPDMAIKLLSQKFNLTCK